MGVSGVASDNSAWTLQGMQDQKGMQIDLIIERSDRVINLCEMKFVNTNFEVKKEYKTVLSERLNWITSHVKKNQNVQMTLVTTYGLKQGIHSGIFQRTITLDNLFD